MGDTILKKQYIITKSIYVFKEIDTMALSTDISGIRPENTTAFAKGEIYSEEEIMLALIPKSHIKSIPFMPSVIDKKMKADIEKAPFSTTTLGKFKKHIIGKTDIESIEIIEHKILALAEAMKTLKKSEDFVKHGEVWSIKLIFEELLRDFKRFTHHEK